MKVGFGSLTCQRGPGDPRPDGDRYREALELAAHAERVGFDSVWLSEHHFMPDGYTPSLLVLAAAIAARTERIGIGTGVLLAPLHNAVRLAEDAATAQLLSGGRLVLGVAQGWRREEFDGIGVPYRGRHLLFEEIVRTLREAWGDGPVTPKPDPPPPLWIGGVSESAVRRAGRMGDAFTASWHTVDEFRERVAWARDENPEIAVAIVLPVFAWDGDPWPHIREPLEYYISCFQGAGDTPESLVVGRPEEVAAAMLAYEEAAGTPIHFTAEFCWPGLAPSVLSEANATFGERVLPLVRP